MHNISKIPPTALHLWKFPWNEIVFVFMHQCQINITISNVFDGGWWIVGDGEDKQEYRQGNRNWFVIVWVFYLIEFNWLLLKRTKKRTNYDDHAYKKILIDNNQFNDRWTPNALAQLTISLMECLFFNQINYDVTVYSIKTISNETKVKKNI